MIRRLARTIIPMTVLLVLLVAVAPAEARCQVEWDCSRGYSCRQVQVCDSSIDIPAIPPPSISPIPPPTIAPIPRPVVPPIGTAQCRQAYTTASWSIRTGTLERVWTTDGRLRDQERPA